MKERLSDDMSQVLLIRRISWWIIQDIVLEIETQKGRNFFKCFWVMLLNNDFICFRCHLQVEQPEMSENLREGSKMTTFQRPNQTNVIPVRQIQSDCHIHVIVFCLGFPIGLKRRSWLLICSGDFKPGFMFLQKFMHLSEVVSTLQRVIYA